MREVASLLRQDALRWLDCGDHYDLQWGDVTLARAYSDRYHIITNASELFSGLPAVRCSGGIAESLVNAQLTAEREVKRQLEGLAEAILVVVAADVR